MLLSEKEQATVYGPSNISLEKEHCAKRSPDSFPLACGRQTNLRTFSVSLAFVWRLFAQQI